MAAVNVWVKRFLALLCVYRVFAVISADIPAYYACSLDDFRTDCATLYQHPVCEMSCKFHQALGLDMHEYLVVDPVTANPSAQLEAIMGIYAFAVSPAMLVVVLGIYANARWAFVSGAILAGIMFGVLSPLFLEWVYVSPAPQLAMLYNILDIVIPATLLLVCVPRLQTVETIGQQLPSKYSVVKQ